MEVKAISDELLNILVCPETKQQVSLISDQDLARINSLISEGKLLKKSGAKAEEALIAGLLREDRKVLYPIIEGIPVMLIEESLVVENII